METVNITTEKICPRRPFNKEWVSKALRTNFTWTLQKGNISLIFMKDGFTPNTYVTDFNLFGRTPSLGAHNGAPTPPPPTSHFMLFLSLGLLKAQSQTNRFTRPTQEGGTAVLARARWPHAGARLAHTPASCLPSSCITASSHKGRLSFRRSLSVSRGPPCSTSPTPLITLWQLIFKREHTRVWRFDNSYQSR